jgi:vacuolar-type H+-ATPase subunit E/Vma4
MPPVDKDIERLTEAVMGEVGADAEKIRSEAQVKADAIRQKAKEEAEAHAQDILKRAALEAERIHRQGLASAELKARLLHLDHREKLLQNVFQTARQKLPAVQQRKDYDQVALQLLREALVHLGASAAQIQADPTTRKYLTPPALEALSKELNVQLTLAGALEDRLGVVVETHDGRMHYDNTFETRLARLQNSLRSAVNHILMGEAL